MCAGLQADLFAQCGGFAAGLFAPRVFWTIVYGIHGKLGTVQSSPQSPKPCRGTEPSVLNIFSLSVFFSLSPFQSLSVLFSPYTYL